VTNRTKPGPGMGPSWKELIESGELQRIVDRGVKPKSRPKVINKGSMCAPIPDGAKLVGRTTRWGNPFALDDPDDDGERAGIIRMHREWVLTSDDPKTITSRRAGKGRTIRGGSGLTSGSYAGWPGGVWVQPRGPGRAQAHWGSS
jgi:hypothetical protein